MNDEVGPGRFVLAENVFVGRVDHDYFQLLGDPSEIVRELAVREVFKRPQGKDV
jgi:hypothetical protein